MDGTADLTYYLSAMEAEAHGKGTWPFAHHAR
jgi:hypothetical protein